MYQSIYAPQPPPMAAPSMAASGSGSYGGGFAGPGQHAYAFAYGNPSAPQAVASGSGTGSYLEGTLAQIVTLSNEDVEMKDATEFNLDYTPAFLVVDTNILMHRFEVLTQFVEDIERNSIPVIVIIPSVVVSELDGHKKNSERAWFARRASSWLLAKMQMKDHRHVKGQARTETRNSAKSWRGRDEDIPDAVMRKAMFNDSLILDCWKYFYDTGTATFLCSNDTNLCIATASESMAIGFNGIQSEANKFFTISERGSSREIARHIWGHSVNLKPFYEVRGYRKDEKSSQVETSSRREAPQAYAEDDSMDVDDEDTGPMAGWRSELPVNILHDEVVDYFSRLLVDLVGKVGGEEVRQHDPEDKKLSRWAVRRRHFSSWSMEECVEWLITKARDPRREGGRGPVVIKQEYPELQRFLRKHYKGVPGSKTGVDWSRQGWRVALNNLRKISDAWGDESIAESLAGLEPYVDTVFGM